MIAVLFEGIADPKFKDRYLEIAETLKPEVINADGFIAMERFQSLSNQGKVLSLSFWRDKESVKKWKKNLLHKSAQTEGQNRIFSHYRIRVTKVFRDYQFDAKDV